MRKSSAFLFLLVLVLGTYISLVELKKQRKEAPQQRGLISSDRMTKVNALKISVPSASEGNLKDFEFIKSGDDWSFKDSLSESVDQYRVEKLLQSIFYGKIGGKVDSSKEQKLDRPVAVIELSFLDSDKPEIIKLGDLAPVGDYVFAELNGENVSLLHSQILDTIPESINEFRSRVFFSSADLENVEKLVYESEEKFVINLKEQSLEKENGAKFKLKKAALESFLSSISKLRISSFVSLADLGEESRKLAGVTFIDENLKERKLEVLSLDSKTGTYPVSYLKDTAAMIKPSAVRQFLYSADFFILKTLSEEDLTLSDKIFYQNKEETIEIGKDKDDFWKFKQSNYLVDQAIIEEFLKGFSKVEFLSQVTGKPFPENCKNKSEIKIRRDGLLMEHFIFCHDFSGNLLVQDVIEASSFLMPTTFLSKAFPKRFDLISKLIVSDDAESFCDGIEFEMDDEKVQMKKNYGKWAIHKPVKIDLENSPVSFIQSLISSQIIRIMPLEKAPKDLSAFNGRVKLLSGENELLNFYFKAVRKGVFHFYNPDKKLFFEAETKAFEVRPLGLVQFRLFNLEKNSVKQILIEANNETFTWKKVGEDLFNGVGPRGKTKLLKLTRNQWDSLLNLKATKLHLKQCELSSIKRPFKLEMTSNDSQSKIIFWRSGNSHLFCQFDGGSVFGFDLPAIIRSLTRL